jgi:putative redox protein
MTFEGSQGDQLAARLDVPSATPMATPLAYALFAHCFTCSKDVLAASRITRGLLEQGIAVLRFDFTGLGSSDGEFANTNFSSNVEDLVRAIAALRDRYEAPRILIGHSLGGAAMLAAAAHAPEAVAVVTIGAPIDPGHVTSLFPPETLAALETADEATVELAGRPFRIRRQFLDDAGAQHLEPAIHTLHKALLLFHSPVDEIVDIDHARRIFEAARHPKSFVSLDHADHLLTDPADAAYVASVLAAWVSRYLPPASASTDVEVEMPVLDLPAGTVTVTERGTGKFAQEIRMGNHVVYADEPLGTGDDTGPNPYDLLLAGLGACTSMTVRMYADHKQIPLDHVSVQLHHDRVHVEDCDPDANPGCRIEHIDRVISLGGALSDDQRAALLAVADRCPVHRTLSADKQILTTLA